MADYDLNSYAKSMDPMQRQMLLANQIRAGGRMDDQGALAAANEKSRQFDTLAAVSQMMGNPGAAHAVMSAQKSAGALAPEKMGTTGFMLPESGQFIESPMYADEKRLSREAVADNQAARLAAQEHENALRRDQQAQHQQMMYGLAQTMQEIRRQALQDSGDAREARLALTTERFRNTQSQQQQQNVEKFGAALQKNALPEMSSAVQSVNSMLERHPKGDIPGVGLMQKTATTLPFGINQLVSSDEAISNRGSIQALENIKALLRSGKAVTVPESVRLDIENMAGDRYTPDQFRDAWNKRVLPALEAVRSNVHKSFTPSVVEDYMTNAPGEFDPRKPFYERRQSATRSASSPSRPGRIRYDSEGNEVK